MLNTTDRMFVQASSKFFKGFPFPHFPHFPWRAHVQYFDTLTQLREIKITMIYSNLIAFKVLSEMNNSTTFIQNKCININISFSCLPSPVWYFLIGCNNVILVSKADSNIYLKKKQNNKGLLERLQLMFDVFSYFFMCVLFLDVRKHFWALTFIF